MYLSMKNLMVRIEKYIKDAKERFSGSPYVTIYGHIDPTTLKSDPFKVYFDINVPHYVERNGKPVWVSGQKGCCVTYPPGHPQQRPIVTTPETIVSVHSWGPSKKLCLYTIYIPELYSLTTELEKVLMLAANCPESINYKSMCPPMSHYEEWTRSGLKNGTLPTVPKSRLLGNYKSSDRRSVSSLRGLV